MHRIAFLACLALLTLACGAPARSQALAAAGELAGNRQISRIPGFAYPPPPPRIVSASGATTGLFLPRGPSLTPAGIAGAGTLRPSEQCRAAIAAAEQRHGIPRGLLAAISVVESGRRDEVTGERAPWPWTINAEGAGHYFDSKGEAVAWVQRARADGMRSIDTGCMQINMLHHPNAFASVDQAFDPVANADYAGRFLAELRNKADGDWMRAAGFYHSQTPHRAEGYRRHVEAAMNGAGRSAPAQSGPYGSTSVAYGTASAQPQPPAAAPTPPPTAGTGAPFLSNRSAAAVVIAASAGTVGRGLDAYRAAPTPVVGRLAFR